MSVNSKFKGLKEIVDKQSENRINELRRALEKTFNDSQVQQDQEIRILIMDKLEDRQRT